MALDGLDRAQRRPTCRDVDVPGASITARVESVAVMQGAVVAGLGVAHLMRMTADNDPQLVKPERWATTSAWTSGY